MQADLYFSEEDKQKVVEFLNMVANHAEFKMQTPALINYFKLLAHMQQKILPKIDANILEVRRVVEANDKESVPQEIKPEAKK